MLWKYISASGRQFVFKQIYTWCISVLLPFCRWWVWIFYCVLAALLQVKESKSRSQLWLMTSFRHLIFFYLRLNRNPSCWNPIFALIKTSLVVWTVHYEPKYLDTYICYLMLGKNLLTWYLLLSRLDPSISSGSNRRHITGCLSGFCTFLRMLFSGQNPCFFPLLEVSCQGCCSFSIVFELQWSLKCQKTIAWTFFTSFCKSSGLT